MKRDAPLMLLLRILVPLALLSGCLSQDHPAREEDPQGDDVDKVLLKEPEAVQQKETLPCFEADHRFPTIIPMDTWDEKKNTIYLPAPVTYIVIRDGGKRCNTHAECLTALTNALRKTVESQCRTLDNFYIGGDGAVFEGRGWSKATYWHLNGMRTKAVTVKFLGTHDTEGPSERAVSAFWRMAKSGVWQNKLSADYNFLSMGQVYNDSKLVGQALEKVFLEHSLAVKEVNMMDMWEMTPDKSLQLVTREEWGAKRPTRPATRMEFRIKYVMINEGGERCFTHEDCLALIKEEQEKQMLLYGDVVDNFYVGDDGYVYEGRGFNFKPLWDINIDFDVSNIFKEDSMTVKIFGKFQSALPSENAIGALKLLVNAGVSLNRISDNYKIFSLRGIYNDAHFLGDRLLESARKWKPWHRVLEDLTMKKIREGEDFIGMVKRTTWGAKDSVKDLDKLEHPVDHIIIEESSDYDRCLDSKKCSELMTIIQEADQEGYGDVRANFYVSDNGNVYEGRGWDLKPQFQLKYFNKSLITVSFLGYHHDGEPSLTALAAFDNLIRVGVNRRKIAPNYHFYSSREVYNDVYSLGDGFQKNFAEKEQWSKKLDAMNEDDRLESGLLPIVPHEVWSEITVNATHHQLTEPVHYVVIGNIGERCYTDEECTSNLRESENNKKGLLDNFYIGDDGMAYEARGWSMAPSLYKKGLKSVFYRVTFLGQYGDKSKASRLSILAFNRLMENGVKSNKLAPDYKIVSIHHVLNSEAASDDNLYATVKTWDRYTTEFTLMPEGDGMPTVNKMFVSRNAWHAEEPAHVLAIPDQPVGFVVVHRAGVDCGDLDSCKRSVKGIQESTPSRQWDVPDNFYVGDDGHVYEGRGWDHSSLWATRGFENNFLSIGFLGSFEKAPPSPRALLAFHVLVQKGVIMKKLSPYFDTLSLGKIVTGDDVVTEKLIGALETTDNWSDDFELKYDPARLRSLNTSFVLQEEWNLSDRPVRKSSKMNHPLKYLAIRDGGDPCDTFDACLARINKEHKTRHEAGDNGIAENFYIGNDGNVYEGCGWDWDMSWGFNNWQKTVSVQFFGVYKNELPSEKAIEALNSIIIKDGIETGKLLPDYEIAPIPEEGDRTIGKKLKEQLATWKNAIEAIP